MSSDTGKPLAVQITAPSDPNGNTRRGWYLYSPAGVYLGFVDEHGRGSGALREAVAAHTGRPAGGFLSGHVTELCSVPTSVSVYRRAAREAFPLDPAGFPQADRA